MNIEYILNLNSTLRSTEQSIINLLSNTISTYPKIELSKSENQFLEDCKNGLVSEIAVNGPGETILKVISNNRSVSMWNSNGEWKMVRKFEDEESDLYKDEDIDQKYAREAYNSSRKILLNSDGLLEELSKLKSMMENVEKLGIQIREKYSKNLSYNDRNGLDYATEKLESLNRIFCQYNEETEEDVLIDPTLSWKEHCEKNN